MDRLLRSHWVVKITAFLIALMMYTTVAINDQDANQDEKGVIEGEGIYKTVSLDAEYDKDRYVLLGKPDRVEVEFRGSQGDLTNLGLQRTQNAYIDLAGKGAGEYEVPVKMSNAPNDVQVIFKEPTVTVNLHEKATETFPVNIQLLEESNLPKGYVAGTPKANLKEIEITGAKELIDQIDYVRGFVNVANETKTIKKEVKLKAYDKSFEVIKIELEPATTEVTVPIENPSKDVPTAIQKNGSVPKGLKLKSVTALQEEVTVFAPKNILNELNSVEVPVNVSGVSEDKTVKVKVPLPKGALYSSPGDVAVKIDVEPIKKEASTYSVKEMLSFGSLNQIPMNVLNPLNIK